MKTFHVLTILVISLLMSFAPIQSMAQDEKKPTKVKKELKQVMKELPDDLQLQVLRFAERQRTVYKASVVRREELKVNPQSVTESPKAKPVKQAQGVEKSEKMAQPAPQKAQEIKLNNESQTSLPGTAAAPAPAAPAKPEYMRIAESMPQTSIQWMEESFDFGEVKEGEQPTHIYKFKNTGNQPLKITRVKPSCGCTTPGWSKEEIAPGEEGYVEVSYNSKNRPGMANKSITVTGNFVERTKILRFRVNVVK